MSVADGSVQVVNQRCARALIARGGRVLLLREASTHPEGTTQGCWVLPGGRLNRGETIVQGLIREVFEETKLKITVGMQVHSGLWSPVIKDVVHLCKGTFHLCTLDCTLDEPAADPAAGPAIVLNLENDSYAWVGLFDLGGFVVAEPDRTAIVRYFLDCHAGAPQPVA